MPTRSARPTRTRTRTKPPKRAQNYDLIEARRRAREQREIVKRTRALRRDLALHRRELCMLWMDLTRQFAGKFPDELGLDDGEPPVVEPTLAPTSDGAGDRTAPNVIREHARA